MAGESTTQVPAALRWVNPLVLLLCAGIFVFDWLMPLGYAEWVLYLVPLLLTSVDRNQKSPFVLAAACTALVILGLFVSPPAGDLQLAVFNRGSGVIVLWTTALLLVWRKRADASLRESEERYHSLVANSMDAVLLTALDGRVLSANPAACRMFGHSEEELIQMGRNGVVDLSDPRLAVALAERARLGGFLGELTFVRKDGTKFAGELSSAMFTNQHGEQRTSMVIRDITGRKLAEREVERLASFPRFNPNPVMDVDVAGAVTYCNPAAAEALKQLGVEDARNFVPADWEGVVIALRKQPAVLLQREVGIKDRLFDERICLAAGFDSVRIYARDITERKRVEEALCASREQLELLAQRLVTLQETSQREMARELHDRVGQNLTALNLNLSITKDALPPEAEQDVGTRIEDSLRLVTETMEHVRDVMAELRPPALADYGLAAALRLLGEQFARRAGLSVHVSAAETFPRLSTAAEMALFRVAQEAMTNIVKHARAGEVRITMEGGEDGLRLAISDDGVGFDPLSPKLGGGTAALGLALMRERARAIGWELLVESAPGKGAKVVVELARRE